MSQALANNIIHEVKYFPGPVAKRFHADRDSRVKLLIGPFGTGKTSSAFWDIVMQQSHMVMAGKDGIKRSRFAVVRNTLPQLRDTTMSTCFDWFPPGLFGDYMATEKKYVVRIQDREIEIIFRALDIEKDVRNLLSLELTGSWFDESREIKQTVFLHTMGRIGRYPSVKDFDGANPFLMPPQVILTSNYPSREHWHYRMFVEKPEEGYMIYEQDQSENIHNLRPGYYQDLERDYRDRPDLLRTLVRGQWGVTVRGKQVYPEFDHKAHVADQPLLPLVKTGIQYRRQVIRGWDNTGLSPACVLTYINSSGQWLIFKEFIGDDIGIVEFAQAVKLWCAQELPPITTYRDIADPAGKSRDSTKQSPADYMAQHCGIILEDGIQTFKVRREAVVSRLVHRTHGLLIDPSCIRLIDGFEGGYSYPEIQSTGMFGTEPQKNEYSHIHDALQYPATRLFVGGKPDRVEDTLPEHVGDA